MSRHTGIPNTSLRQLLKSSAVTFAVLVAGLVLTIAACTKDAPSESNQVVLEAAQSSGDSPWTESVTAPVDLSATADTLDSTMVTPLSGDDTATVSGDAPGLYGGSNELSVCDRAQLSSFLEANPEQAQAWADIVGAPEVSSYIDSLTPVVLTKDTNVTNHGYSDGEAQPFQAVLQAGTAVMVDSHGVPKVRCECGNPLAAPEKTATDETFVGDRWEAFDATKVVSVIDGANTQSKVVQSVTVVDGAVVAEGTTEKVESGTLPDENQTTPVDPTDTEQSGEQVDPSASEEAPADETGTDGNTEELPGEEPGDDTEEGNGTDGQEGEYPDTGGTEGQGDVQIETEQPPATE